jgi:hypothetical protein
MHRGLARLNHDVTYRPCTENKQMRRTIYEDSLHLILYAVLWTRGKRMELKTHREHSGESCAEDRSVSILALSAYVEIERYEVNHSRDSIILQLLESEFLRNL